MEISFDQIPKEVWTIIAASIGACGVILGALFAFGGVLANNYFEDKRRGRAQKHALIREAYYGCMDYISANMQMLMTLGQNPMANLEGNRESIKNYFTLYLIASPKVIKSFAQCSAEFSNQFFKLAAKKLHIEKLEKEISNEKMMMQAHQARMKEITDQHDRYISEKRMIPELSNMMLAEHDRLLELFSAGNEKNALRHTELFTRQIEFLEETTKTTASIYPSVYDLILSMREDLDIQLSPEDLSQIKKSLDNLAETTKLNTENLIRQLETLMEEFTSLSS